MIKITSNAGYATYFMVDYLLNGEMVRYTSCEPFLNKLTLLLHSKSG